VRWTFFRAGGFDHVKVKSGADLMHLGELDQKLWVALACPTTSVARSKPAAKPDPGPDEPAVGAGTTIEVELPLAPAGLPAPVAVPS
jgi:hypothetical protein